MTNNLFFSILFLVHFQAAIIPIIIGIKSNNKFKNLKNSSLLPFGFILLGLASMSEMIDHHHTNWIYVNHSSIFNWLFYSFLSLGLTTLSISVIKNKFIFRTNLILCLGSILSYLFFGKTTALFLQGIISIGLIINWQRTFKDWLFIAYPIFGIIITTISGTYLSITSNQIWHLLIGPSGTVSVLTFYIVLKRSTNKSPKNS